MKRIIILVTIMMLLVTSVTTAYAGTTNVQVNPTESTVEISRPTTNYSSFKVIVEKDDVDYIYNLNSESETFPLQMGSGEYKVSIYGSNDGRRFRLLSKETITVELEENAVFLSSSQTVNWNIESEVTALAITLTEDAETDREKLEAIYEYVINNISYDYNKARKMPKGYIPSAESTLTEGLGVCYDFAAITAAMLRSVDVPTKLIKGYSAFTPVYHAWNEVFVDGEWIVIDTSTASIFLQYNASFSLEQDVEDYRTSKEY